MKKWDIAVVGSGIAGLTSAALLAQSGKSVVLFESHDKVGGCAGFFDVPSKHGNFRFPTGATVALGVENGGLHQEIFQKLGVECPSVPIEKLAVYLPDLKLDLWHDAEKWRLERRRLPGNRAGQERFWRLQELVADAGWFALSRKPALPMQSYQDLLRNLALAHPKIAPMLAALPFSVGEAMKWLRVDRDSAFCALVNLQLLITTQSLSHAAPLGNGMAGLDLWRHGARHPLGGVGSIAQRLLEGLEKCGGETKFGARVTCLRRCGQVWELETASGEVLRAQRVIANLPVGDLAPLLDFSAPLQLPKAARRAGRGWGAITLYCAVRGSAIPTAFPLHAQVLMRYHSTPPYLKPGTGDDAFLSLSFPGDLKSAPANWRALNVSTHVRLEEWRDLTPLQYREKKKWWREKLLDAVRSVLPDFDAGKGFVIGATPSTWQDYTLRSGGGVGGAPLTRRNANLRALPSRVGLADFHLVGDTTFPGQGTVACALSGFNAWRDITES